MRAADAYSRMPWMLAAFSLLAAVGAADVWQFHLGNGVVGLALYLVLAGPPLAWLLLRWQGGRTARVLSSAALWALLLLALAVVDQVHFRAAQHKPNPMTTAMALEVPGRLMLHGIEPYHCILPGGAPVSPGPGWIALLLPLTAPAWTGLLCMGALGCAALAMAARSRVAAGLFCLMMLAQPLFQSQAANGQDLYAIALAVVAICVLLERLGSNRRAVIALGVLAGLIATARMPMPLFLCVPGLGLARSRQKHGLLFTAIMLSESLAINFAFSVWAHHSGDIFQPMHVFRRGAYGAGYLSELAVVLLSAAALWWILFRMGPAVEDWMLGAWMLMAALFTPESLKEWQQWQFFWGWEGANYLTFSLPLLAAALALYAAGRWNLQPGSPAV